MKATATMCQKHVRYGLMALCFHKHTKSHDVCSWYFSWSGYLGNPLCRYFICGLISFLLWCLISIPHIYKCIKTRLGKHWSFTFNLYLFLDPSLIKRALSVHIQTNWKYCFKASFTTKYPPQYCSRVFWRCQFRSKCDALCHTLMRF